MNAQDRSLPRLQEAIAYALTAHAGQVRKGTAIPYASHLLAVCAIVQEHGGNEDLACAAMLHDTIEDCGAAHGPAIEARFGPGVATIVRACSDTGNLPKPPWQARKEAYLAHLEEADAGTLLVSCADKLHNARAIVTDLRTHGPAILGRFNAAPGGTAWYYQALAKVFARRLPGPLARELALAADDLAGLAGRATGGGTQSQRYSAPPSRVRNPRGGRCRLAFRVKGGPHLSRAGPPLSAGT